MSRLVIKRNPEFINSYRDLNLILDGKPLGSITQNEVREFEIPAGQHSFKSTIDWCSSPEIELELKENETRIVEIESFKGAKKLIKLQWLLIPMYFSVIFFPNFFDHQPVLSYALLALASIPIFYVANLLTFGRKKYLRLKME